LRQADHAGDGAASRRHQAAAADRPANRRRVRRSGNPTTYEAIRSATALYVEYADGKKEYHDLVADPDELRNTYASLPDDRKAALHAALDAVQTCRGAAGCLAAEHVERIAGRN
jgi:hypothetical protein